MATINIENIRKNYGKNEVIRGVDAEIGDGELVVIVGPSGCGKSTLLRMVAGLEVVTSGIIRIDDQIVNDMEPKDRDIAMVFQTYALYPHMTVFNNMAYGLKIAKLPKEEIRERVEQAASILELSDLLQRKPRELSGGQRQRVAMGRAIVRKPSVFLFDEPLSNLDALLRVQMRLEIKQLQRKLGVTLLYVTHDQVEAMTLADRLIVMNNGIAEQFDSPMAIYTHPASVFVAGFIGSPGMNFLTGTLDGSRGEVKLANGDILCTNLEKYTLGSDIETVTVGIRPEHLQIANQNEALLAVHVIAVETLGADIVIHGYFRSVKNINENSVHREKMSVRLAGNATVQEGDNVQLTIDQEKLHLFRQASGIRIT